MEPPSAPPRRGHGPWQGLLLAVSLLTFWNPPATAQLTVTAVPSSAPEGTNVLLLARSVPKNVKAYSWYRGIGGMDNRQIAIYHTDTRRFIPGPEYSGRQIVYHNGSLLVQNAEQKDAGFYTLQTLSRDLQAGEAWGQLHLYCE